VVGLRLSNLARPEDPVALRNPGLPEITAQIRHTIDKQVSDLRR